jgi:hypothetical protein
MLVRYQPLPALLPEAHREAGSQVFLYSSTPLDSSGIGTSNITMSSVWAPRPSTSCARTAAAQVIDEQPAAVADLLERYAAR